MTPTLWIFLYAYFVFMAVAIVYGHMIGEQQRWLDDQQRRLAERRREHFRRINRFTAEAAYRGKVDAAARTWSA